jgi:hypothetical protein
MPPGCPFVWGLAAAIVMAGCSGRAADPPAGPGVCNDLDNVGEPVLDVHLSDPMPSPTGGTILDGTYVRTASTYYETGDDAGSAHRRRETWDIGGDLARRVYQRDDDSVETGTFTLVTSGNTVIESSTCPDTSAVTFGFDATATMIRRYNFRYREVITYTRR